MLPSFFPSLAPLATAASAWCTDTGALASVRARSANPVWSAWAYVSCPCYLRVDLRPSPGLCCLHVGANTRTARDIRPQPARAKISAARLADPASGLRPAAIDTPVPAGRRYRTTTQRTGRPAGAGSHARLGRTTARTRRDSSSRQHTGPGPRAATHAVPTAHHPRLRIAKRNAYSASQSHACRIFAASLALASTRWRVQISHFGAVQVRPGVSAFWWRSCLAVPGTRLAAGLGA